MKKYWLIFAIFLCLVISGRGNISAQDKVSKQSYLGQKPPGMSPIEFAPEVISKVVYKFNSSFSPDGKEFFFSESQKSGRETLRYVVLKDNGWTLPKSPAFNSPQKDCDPIYSKDGNRLYFISTRPKDLNGESKDWDIWYVERIDSVWSEPHNIGSPVNSDSNEYYVSLADNGNIYFASNRPGGSGSFDIYRSKLENGNYLNAENLGISVNSEYLEHDPFISADESFIIFTSVNRPGGFGKGDLYVSFRLDDDSWTEAENLGKTFNTADYDYCPTVSPDGKYFFYTSSGKLFWVSAEIISAYK